MAGTDIRFHKAHNTTLPLPTTYNHPGTGREPESKQEELVSGCISQVLQEQRQPWEICGYKWSVAVCDV